jgi:hypothetical protein
MPQNLQAESQDLLIPAHGIRSDGNSVTLLDEGDIYDCCQLQVVLQVRAAPEP